MLKLVLQLDRACLLRPVLRIVMAGPIDKHCHPWTFNKDPASYCHTEFNILMPPWDQCSQELSSGTSWPVNNMMEILNAEQKSFGMISDEYPKGELCVSRANCRTSLAGSVEESDALSLACYADQHLRLMVK